VNGVNGENGFGDGDGLISYCLPCWDGMGWDGMGWDGMGWDGMGWNGMGWDGMGWDGMGWDGHHMSKTLL
jgi:pentapeptide MXKDX repeat protein